MEVFVFPFGVILVPAIAAKLDIDKYRIAYEKTAMSNAGGKTRITKYQAWVEKFYKMEINGVRCVVFPRYTLAALIRERQVVPKFVVDGGGRRRITRELATNPEFRLYDYQASIADVVVGKYLCEERLGTCKASCLIKLDTGLGKSYIIAEVIRRTRLHTVIIVPQIELAKQFAGDIRATLGDIKVSLEPDVHCDVCILVINTAVNYDKTFYNQFGLVVFDEVPAYCTETRRAIFFHAKQYAAIGMSATPYRRDNLHILLQDHLGPVVDQADFDEIKSDFKIVYKQHRYHTPEQYVKPHKNEASGGMSFMLSCRDSLTFDPDRNELAARLSYDLYRRGRPHFVFTIIADHARFLAEYIDVFIAAKEEGRSTDVPTTSATPASTALPPTIAKLAGNDPVYGLRDSDIIVSTYAKGAVGISINKVTAAIWVMPPYETQYTQLVGRVTRKNAANPEADKIIREIHIIRDSAYWLKKHFDKIDERLHLNGDVAAAVPIAPPTAYAEDSAIDTGLPSTSKPRSSR